METTHQAVIETRVEKTNEGITHVFHVNQEHTDWPTSTLVSEAIEIVVEKLIYGIEPLAHAIDPDALDDLFSDRWDGHRRVRGEITFPVDDYSVSVTANKQIIVTENT